MTNKKRESTIYTLEAFDIIDYFEAILGGDDTTCRKPSPCPLDMVIGKSKIQKDKTIIVGDMAIDILAGKEAGISTCGVTYGIGKKQSIIDAKPDFIIDDIVKLKDIIC